MSQTPWSTDESKILVGSKMGEGESRAREVLRDVNGAKFGDVDTTDDVDGVNGRKRICHNTDNWRQNEAMRIRDYKSRAGEVSADENDSKKVQRHHQLSFEGDKINEKQILHTIHFQF